MLVLSRKKDEQLQVGDDIVVTILKVKGNSVQIGIEAPRNVKVLRGELATATTSLTPGKPDQKQMNRCEDSAPRAASPLKQYAAQVNRRNATAEALQLV